ncbi:TetR/AcrR family transcriptional regulator [Rhodococcus sp. BP-252]|nr:TetR/AcrR family transcriptional regulator [Rhodococcus sp. BP-320]MBY6415187.1 TetR/AcrR family transcriptional regulator [Rhodococcus sp. BP-321]MBY6421510.1 TetR/AcrR family transcriptional regulator [Rhodococcus sp. BP-324]MBY6425505.1 TetR/AcrR family transcriptional regulator [Rhodococcus sp. BP-323]MBY6430083.1 TetR/AcrR family transcriptional regulator [Rhodococcus sp. BP-322]MBY6438688.1 TetR/AcrR family transcriptional regulator [Rhodococcus sp. BP-319]MBY6443650.1 TetR/AcrR fami
MRAGRWRSPTTTSRSRPDNGAVTHSKSRSPRAAETREVILTAAERLFAEQGVFAVSNRQVSEAAGQGNNTAVGYHFGTKEDLVRAIVVKHARGIERIRRDLLESDANDDSDRDDLRTWITLLVRPSTDYLAQLGRPTWYARFAAQVITDPVLRPIVYEEALASASLRRIVAGLDARKPDLPADVRSSRGAMARNLMTHFVAETERDVADSRADPVEEWNRCGTDLIDAIVGLWQAPSTR